MSHCNLNRTPCLECILRRMLTQHLNDLLVLFNTSKTKLVTIHGAKRNYAPILMSPCNINWAPYFQCIFGRKLTPHLKVSCIVQYFLNKATSFHGAHFKYVHILMSNCNRNWALPMYAGMKVHSKRQSKSCMVQYLQNIASNIPLSSSLTEMLFGMKARSTLQRFGYTVYYFQKKNQVKFHGASWRQRSHCLEWISYMLGTEWSIPCTTQVNI